MRKDPTEFRKRFAAWKNGKLPYKDGKPVVINNYTNAKFNDDGTFTDDTTRVFDDFYVTPSGVKTKYGSYTDKNWDRYKQQEQFFKYHDQQTGKVKGEPGLEIVSPEYDVISFYKPSINEISRFKNWNGVKLGEDKGGMFEYLLLNRRGRLLGRIELDTYGDAAKIHWIGSKQKGGGRLLMDAAIQHAREKGMLGIRSGDNLLSAPKTYKMWEHYPDKQLISQAGTHTNFNMENVKGPITRDLTKEEAFYNWNNNLFGSFKTGDVYLLKSPSNPIQYWTPYRPSLKNVTIPIINSTVSHKFTDYAE